MQLWASCVITPKIRSVLLMSTSPSLCKHTHSHSQQTNINIAAPAAVNSLRSFCCCYCCFPHRDHTQPRASQANYDSSRGSASCSSSLRCSGLPDLPNKKKNLLQYFISLANNNTSRTLLSQTRDPSSPLHRTDDRSVFRPLHHCDRAGESSLGAALRP